MQLQERVECRHILNFALLPFLEALEEEKVLKLDTVSKLVSIMPKEQRIKAFPYSKDAQLDSATIHSVVKLMEAQINLAMLYFEIYQELRGQTSFYYDNR